MRRIAIAALLAALGMLGAGGSAAANDGPCTFGLGPWGHALRLFPHIHQHGPLYNYGPYYGYPPFEPYGYWNSYLQYTGPVPTPNTAGGGSGSYGWIHGNGSHNPGGLIPHPLQGGRGLLHHDGAGSHRGGCHSCGAAAATYLNSGNALNRYTGVGEPAASMAFYADAPTTIITVGFPGR